MTHGQGRAASRCGSGTVGRLAVGLVAVVLCTGRAHAGGFEAPGQGAEAMGRGGAFAAKADDGSALEYNIAGLARQRGTRVLLDAKLVINKYDFQRTGNYPTENVVGGGAQPWSGMPYSSVSNQHGLSVTPLIAISTDFGYFDRWTFAIGLNTPAASDQNRTYPTTVNGNWPAPQRYDLYNANLIVVYPMLAAAVRVTKWFELGLALQMVYGHFDLKAAAYADLSTTLCPGTEFSGCDSIFHITSSGFTATGVLGLMFHPLESLHVGLNVRGPVYLDTSGQVDATVPVVLKTTLDPGPATLGFRLPWVVRLGIRYAFMRAGRERGDIELDGTYEAWKEAEGDGDPLHIPALGPFLDVKAKLFHHYKDTGSVRLGGAWNFFLKHDSKLTARVGVFYDSSATDSAYTKLDFDTLDKIGVGVGLGFKIRGVTINVAYDYIASPSRTVVNGEQRIINGTNGSNTASGGGPEPAFNNGTFTASTQLVMLGLNFHIDEIMRKQARRDPFASK